jgi:uncharacterized protein YcfJ
MNRLSKLAILAAASLSSIAIAQPYPAPMGAQPYSGGGQPYSGGGQSGGDYAQVIDRRPNLVTVQQRQCQQREVMREGSNTGGVLGALAGGVIGSTLGSNKRDHAAGAAIGAIGGALIGNEISNRNNPQQTEVRDVCQLVPVTVQQGETVTFSYRGRTFTQSFQ